MRHLFALALSAASLFLAVPAWADTYNLVLEPTTVTAAGKTSPALSINGQIPGPLLRWREGEDVTINVTNRLSEDASIHWHGIILPQAMDGVPGLGFEAIKPGETRTYRFVVLQSGTYWYHSHSGLQEQLGVFAPIIIDPAKPDGIEADREYVVILSDWLKESPYEALANLKKQSDYYNYNRRTVEDFFTALRRAPDGEARASIIRDRLAWGRMRMDPTDLTDVSGYAFLVNGKDPATNWTALFKPGERIRLRFVNAAAMTFFDVGIPGLKMTVVQADGQDVTPVPVDQFRIVMGETYDVIVEPDSDRAYTLFAQAFDRTGYARGTLAPREGMSAPVPPMDPRPLRTMADMAGGDAQHAEHEPAAPVARHDGHDPGAAAMPEMDMGEVEMADESAVAPEGLRVLDYADLSPARSYVDRAPPEREVTLRLTGSMQRYYWSIDGRKWPKATPIQVRYGERVRVRIVNETMMDHPMHLHGMWMDLVNPDGTLGPRKHTVLVKPGQTVTVDVTVTATKTWAFHCHILFHAATGMMTTMVVGEVGAP